MKYRFFKSSRKHKISAQRARYVIGTVEPIKLETGRHKETKLLWLGVDSHGVEIEVIGFEYRGIRFITHIMPTKFRRRQKW